MKATKILIITFAAIIFYSCKKDYLDKKPRQFISSDQIDNAGRQDKDVFDGSLLGVYATMLKPGSGGTNLNHDDFGQKGWDIYTDLMCSDMVLAGINYGWYRDVAQYLATVDYTTNTCYMPWRYYYRIIIQANMVIESLGGNNVVPESEKDKESMGQAKALRAYAYFYLSQLYAKGYNATEKILPLYIETRTPNKPKSTAKEIYDQMVKDLTDAVTLLEGYNRPSKVEINKFVAEMLLSYVYAARQGAGDLDKVASLTNDIITNGSFPLTDSSVVVAQFDDKGRIINREKAGFNNVNTSSWMWGVDIRLASDLDLVSWWGQVDLYTYSYASAGDGKVIDELLYSKIREDDVRKNQFVDFYKDGEFYPTNKFFTPDRIPDGQRTVTTDYVYMRVEEAYLLNAEANAKLGNDIKAREALKELLKNRVKDYSYVDALSGGALQAEIYLQTRIELWGEGKSYLAMKRNKATVKRGANHLYFAGESFQWNDDRLMLKIPQSEVLDNPFLND